MPGACSGRRSRCSRIAIPFGISRKRRPFGLEEPGEIAGGAVQVLHVFQDVVAEDDVECAEASGRVSSVMSATSSGRFTS